MAPCQFLSVTLYLTGTQCPPTHDVHQRWWWHSHHFRPIYRHRRSTVSKGPNRFAIASERLAADATARAVDASNNVFISDLTRLMQA
jgi:hypothetical protein